MNSSIDVIPASDDDAMFTGEAARILEVGERTVRIYAERGDLKTKRTAAGVRIYSRADVLALARERRARRLRAIDEEAERSA